MRRFWGFFQKPQKRFIAKLPLAAQAAKGSLLL
jgi:hypothetical protein